MDVDIVIKQILTYRTKPDLSKYTLDDLKLFLQKINKTNDSDRDENTNRNYLEDKIIQMWNSNPILDDNTNEIVECMFCFNPITNSDFITIKCNHQSHSSCFFKYLYVNFNEINSKNNNSDNNEIKINNLFRCPVCRNNLTDNVDLFNDNVDLFNDNVDLFNDNIVIINNDDYENYENYDNEQIYSNNITGNILQNIGINLITGEWLPNSNTYTNSSNYYLNSNSNSNSNSLNYHLDHNVIITNSLFNRSEFEYDNDNDSMSGNSDDCE